MENFGGVGSDPSPGSDPGIIHRGWSDGLAVVVLVNPQPAGLSHETILLFGQEPSVYAKISGASTCSGLNSLFVRKRRGDSMALQKVAS